MQSILIPTPLGELLAAAEGERLARLDFSSAPVPEGETCPVLEDARRWLSEYFAGHRPDFTPALAPAGTSFQRLVRDLLLSVPYGESVTYGELARRISLVTGRRTSPRAVGQAVGRNPICLIVPCHRVLGAGGAVTGYAYGLDRKRFLLTLEGIPWRD